MNRLPFLIVSIALILLQKLNAQPVRISIYNELPLQTVVISVSGNSCTVEFDNGTTFEPPENDVFYLTLQSNKILFRNRKKELGLFSEIKIKHTINSTYFNVNPIVPKANSRQYGGSLEISVAFNRISIINEIEQNTYISGVVEAETGINATIEFYKAQSVLARTYLYGHMNKHESEGFNLCDGVHCQAYHGLATRNPLIKSATEFTNGLVAIINDTTYITAAFHANCGGYTESSQNAWLSKKDYLMPVKDPFCQNAPSARWEKTITTEEWRKYLKSHGFKNAGHIPFIDFSVVNTQRMQYYVVKNDSIPFKQIRTDYQLKSSFFSVSASKNEIIFKGRGYGHGVGLCQEGAIQMAKVGYKFEEILKYYYKGIEIIKK